MRELLKRLCDAHGPTGFEDPVARIIKEEFEKYADSVEVDRMGNVIAKKGSGSPVYMVSAHMDEIGFVVKYVDKDGFVWFVLMGGFHEPTIYNSRVLVHSDKGTVPGVIGGKPPHLMEEEEKKKPLKWKELFIDVGACSKEEVLEMGIRVGCPVTLNYSLIDVGNKVCGKALDDRVGCAVLIEVLKGLKGFAGTVFFVATVQEELGLKGARVSAFKLKPDVGLVVDVCMAGQAGVKEREVGVSCGMGPTIYYVEAAGKGLVADPYVTKWVIDAAKRAKIPFQVDVSFGGMTDAAVMSVTGEGVPCASIGIPTRYLHSPVEVLDLRDAENCVKLIIEAIKGGAPKTAFV